MLDEHLLLTDLANWAPMECSSSMSWSYFKYWLLRMTASCCDLGIEWKKSPIYPLSIVYNRAAYKNMSAIKNMHSPISPLGFLRDANSKYSYSEAKNLNNY